MVGLEALRKCDLFEGLSDEELLLIAPLAHEETYEAGAVIFRENDPARDLYMVRDGRVAILINVGRNQQTVIDTIYPNRSFGWSGMVPPYIRTGTTRALVKTRVIAISGRDLQELCQGKYGTCYTIMEKLATIISRRLKDTRLQLIGLMQG